MDNHPEGEVKEMIDIYVEKGFEREDATTIIRTMAKNKDFFVSYMCMEELGLLFEKKERAGMERSQNTIISEMQSYPARPERRKGNP